MNFSIVIFAGKIVPKKMLLQKSVVIHHLWSIRCVEMENDQNVSNKIIIILLFLLLLFHSLHLTRDRNKNGLRARNVTKQ